MKTVNPKSSQVRNNEITKQWISGLMHFIITIWYGLIFLVGLIFLKYYPFVLTILSILVVAFFAGLAVRFIIDIIKDIYEDN